MKDIVMGFRQVVQDLMVPELKAIQVEIKHHSEQFKKMDERFKKMDERFEKIDQRFEKIFTELEELKIGQREILNKLDLDKRLTRVETIIEKAGLFTGMVKEKQEKYKIK